MFPASHRPRQAGDALSLKARALEVGASGHPLTCPRLTSHCPPPSPTAEQECQALSELMFHIRADDVNKCKQIVKREKIKCVFSFKGESAPFQPPHAVAGPPLSLPQPQ